MKINIEKVVEQIKGNSEIKKLSEEIEMELGENGNKVEKLLNLVAANFYLVNVDNYEALRDSFELQKIKENLNYLINAKDEIIKNNERKTEADRDLFKEMGLECILNFKGEKI